MTQSARPLLLGMGWFADTPGGLNRYVRDLHRALRGRGVPVRTLVVGPMTKPEPGVVAVCSATRHVLLRLAAMTWMVLRAVDQHDVVDAHFPLYALPAALLSKRPLVVHFHGPWVDESQSFGERRRGVLHVKLIVERMVYRRADRLVVLSSAFKRLLVERYGVLAPRIDIVPPGVDLDHFRPGDTAAARAGLGLPPAGFIAVAVRRLVPRVGLDVLLEAWAQSRLGHRGGVLLLAGEGKEQAHLERRAVQLRIAESVHFLGRVDDRDLVTLYRCADVSIVPSVELEGFGLIVLESLACGTPVLATDVGGLPEVLQPLASDLVVPARRPDLLARRLVDAADGSRPLPSRAACRTYAMRYEWPKVADRHIQIYGEIGDHTRTRALVVFLDHCARLSGGELALLRLLPELTEVDVHVILGEHGPLEHRLRSLGVSVEVLALEEKARNLPRTRITASPRAFHSILRSLTYSLRLAQRLHVLRPDIVHTNSLKAAMYGGVAGRLAKVPVLWHVRDRISADYMPAAAVRLVRLAARWLPSAIITNSETTRATLGSASSRATVVPSPIDVPVRREVVRANGLVVGIVGRLAPWKGQDVFLRAFAEAFPGAAVRAAVVGGALFGEDEYAASLRSLAADLGISDRVTFHGFREDVAAELASLDILVHASTVPEPFGQVVVEGMAVGLPVIASDAGGPTEVIQHGVDGLLCPPGDVSALASLMRQLATDESLRQRLGQAARSHARRYAAAAVAPSVLAEYRDVLAVKVRR